MTYAETFLAEIEAFLVAAGVSATRFGRESVGDPRLVFDLRSGGRSPSADLMDRVAAYMSAAGASGERSAGEPGRAGGAADLSGRAILLVISGGIAAYKSLDLIRRLRDRQAGVQVVMTRGAGEFITPLSVGALAGGRVYTELFDRADEHDVGHIRLAREADMIVIAPATADLMARMAGGRADDLATAVILAARCPLLLAPAMNPAMWAHPATRRNVATLRGWGVSLCGPVSGEMAEKNEAGLGRMADPLDIVEAAVKLTGAAGRATGSGPLSGRHIVVTSGPTHEPIDPVRYLANRSSGRQGHAIAAAGAAAGARVTLVSGPVHLADPVGVDVVRVETARDMLAAVEAALPADVAIMAAAVADWRAADTAAGKIKKDGSGKPPPLALIENPDILATTGRRDSGRPELVVGFAAETDRIVEYGQAKRLRKGADWILANDVSPNSGVMGGDENEVHVITEEGIEAWPRMAKEKVAQRLIEKIATHLGRRSKGAPR